MNIYVGNIPYSVSEGDLKDAFEAFGGVESARIVMDRETNRSKGFAFVEMSDNDAAQKAIDSLNGSEFGGRKIVVNEARPREEKSSGGFGGDRGGFGGGNRRPGGDRGGFGGDRGDRGDRGGFGRR